MSKQKTVMKTIPKHFKEANFNISNSDHTKSDRDFANKELKGKKLFCPHAAWNFYAYIWHENGKFYEQVTRYGEHLETINGDSVEDVYNQACEKYGKE